MNKKLVARVLFTNVPYGEENEKTLTLGDGDHVDTAHFQGISSKLRESKEGSDYALRVDAITDNIVVLETMTGARFEIRKGERTDILLADGKTVTAEVSEILTIAALQNE